MGFSAFCHNAEIKSDVVEQQVATYLIIFRVADGRAWTQKTAETMMMTSMQFDDRKRGTDTEVELTKNASATDVVMKGAVEHDGGEKV